MTTGFNDWVSICLFQNWGATNPSSLMGIDIDDIEVWNGTPGQGPAAPASLRIVRAALEPFQPLVLPSLAEGWLALLRAWNWCLGLAA
jgi:hypothetical protein